MFYDTDIRVPGPKNGNPLMNFASLGFCLSFLKKKTGIIRRSIATEEHSDPTTCCSIKEKNLHKNIRGKCRCSIKLNNRNFEHWGMYCTPKSLYSKFRVKKGRGAVEGRRSSPFPYLM